MRIEVGSGYGSGVLVAPGQVLTCGHVVHPQASPEGAVRVLLNDGTEHPARIRQILTPPAPGQSSEPFPWPDVAWLSIDRTDHPVVQVDPIPPQYGPQEDQVWAYGHSRSLDRMQVRAQPGAYRVEGPSPEPNHDEDRAGVGRRVRWQVGGGQAAVGMSGAPLLNLRTGRVLGLLTRSRNRDTDLGGWAVALHDAVTLLPELAELIAATDADNAEWRAARWEALGLTALLRPASAPLPPVGRRPPGAVLTARYAVVPFHAAQQGEVNRLVGWAIEPLAGPVRLVTGPAGSGKTRLAVELCRQLEAHGWLARFVPRDLPAPDGVELVAALTTAGDPTLLVVDYAETRADLPRLLDAIADLAQDPRRAPLRVLLLARQAGEWWTQFTNTQLEGVQQIVAATTVMEIGLVPGPAEDLTAAYRDALSALANAQHVPEPSSPPALADEPWTYLRLHMAALTAIPAGNSESASGVITANEALRAIAGRERAYWRNAANSYRLPANLTDDTVLQRAVVTLSLLAARTETEAAQLLRRVPDLHSDSQNAARRQLARWIRHLYPAPLDERLWTAGIQPDLLAQHLAVITLASDPELIPAVLSNLPVEQAEQPLTILTRACRHHSAAPQLLHQALTSDLDGLVLPALRVTMQTGDPLGQILTEHLDRASLPMLEKLGQAMPEHTVALREVAAEVSQALVKSARAADQPEALARHLNHLSIRLAALGRREEALTAAEEAVTVHRALAAAHPEAFTAHLATSLSTVSARAAEVGRPHEALTAIEEAANLSRELAAAHPEDFTDQLARTLNNLAIHLAGVGRPEDALKLTEEAVTYYRALAASQPGVFSPHLASSLHTLSNRLAEVGRFGEALAAIEETVSLRRALAAACPDAFAPDLAVSMNSLGLVLAKLGRHEAALPAIEEAVTAYRVLAVARPEAFTPQLAGCLNNVAAELAELGQLEDALPAIEEAVSLRRALAAACPDAFAPDLAGSLSNLARHLAELGRYEAALTAIAEAVRLYRDLAATRPEAWTSPLAASLNTLAMARAHLGRPQEALTAVGEAVRLYRGLTVTRTDASNRNLAGLLHNMAAQLAQLGRHDEAEQARREARGLLRPPTK